MAFFHVSEVHGIDEGSGGWRADFPNGATESVAGAEGGHGQALTLACIITELCVMSDGNGNVPWRWVGCEYLRVLTESNASFTSCIVATNLRFCSLGGDFVSPSPSIGSSLVSVV